MKNKLFILLSIYLMVISGILFVPHLINVPIYQIDRRILEGCVEFPFSGLRYNGDSGVQFISVDGFGFYPSVGYLGRFTNDSYVKVRVSDRWMGYYWDTVYNVYEISWWYPCSNMSPSRYYEGLIRGTL